jgi:indolepyruvate decarboxylase
MDASICVVADIGDSLFASSDLVIKQQTEFLSPAYYCSMGFSVPAALGVMVARPSLRPIVLAGDGAFQMTGMELSTILRHGFAPIIIVLDNGGYGTERWLHQGEHDFNNIVNWRYSRLPDVLGGGKGYETCTEGQFDAALRQALADRSGFSLIHAHIGQRDASQALERLANKLSRRV